MDTSIDEIAPQIYRFSTFSAQAGIVFNQFLIEADEPLLFHTGQRSLFPQLHEAVVSVMDPSRLRWIAFGFEDDDERKTKGRLKQANMMGPAGLIAMEDGMIGGLVQQGIAGSLDKAAVIEMGGHGIDPIPGSRVSEGSVRGFWTGYRALMGY